MENPRTYGKKPFSIAVLHGGPGAPGEMAPVARELCSLGGVLEPLQTKDSLDGQVEELHAVLREYADLPVTLIGWSWGAMLAYILTSRFPSLVKKLILVDAAPFEEEYARGIMPERLNRMSEETRAELFALVEAMDSPDADKDALMGRFGEIIAGADAYEAVPHENEALEYSYEINRRVWGEAVAMRRSGELLKLGEKIKCPVTAIHGDYDPHPAAGVREPLSRILPDFRFILLEKCGHEPWLERWAKDRFYEVLRREL